MELKMKPLNENDRVRFRCMRCAECCRHVFGAVIVEGLDVYRLSKYLKMSISDFISEFTDQFILDEVTAYPILSLKTVGKDNSCVFLKGSCCTVNEVKPRTCKMYPFGVEPAKEKITDFKYHFSMERKHHPKGTLIRVKDWMKKYFLEEERASLKEEWRSVSAIAPLLYQAQLRGVKTEKLLNTILWFFYYAFDLEQPFLPQQRKNNCNLVVAIKQLISDEK